MANGSNIVGDGGIDATIQQQSLDDIPTNLQKQQAEAKTIRVAKGAISGDWRGLVQFTMEWNGDGKPIFFRSLQGGW